MERSYAEVNEQTLAPLAPPRMLYISALLGLGALIAWAGLCWMYQINQGMGVAGISHPVCWAVYITNFVFWVGIAHSGTLISAILYLVRSRWRAAISRSAEAMTIFAVMTAGLFPLVHLGRDWVFYFILPYPSQRQIWPNFTSPLVWDVVAVGTYFTVSVIFFYVGMIPDLGAARDRWGASLGKTQWRSRLYQFASLGWTGSGRQWQHHNRSYLFFAALATPLVVSVHSVVSWDFAMSLLPGWHTTIFAPYFVAGAIHSGLAMVLTLVIPMRRLFHLDRVITIDHFDAVAQTMIVTTLIVAYAYIIEPFISWYSGDIFEQQFAFWRATGWISPFFWSLVLFNVLAPLMFAFRRVRRSIPALFTIGIMVNIGMWLERFVIIVGSTSHDFLPHNWGPYAPKLVEYSITVGAFAFFLFFFLLFAKFLPTIPISEVKEDIEREKAGGRIHEPEKIEPHEPQPLTRFGGVLAMFKEPQKIVDAVKLLQRAGFKRLETYSPRRLHEVEPLLGRGPSPVRFWTFTGALLGCISGFALAIYAATLNNLIVGGKPPVALIPYCVIGFEATILFGTLANLAGMLFHARLGRPNLPKQYDRQFSQDVFGLYISCSPEEASAARNLLRQIQPEEIHDVR